MNYRDKYVSDPLPHSALRQTLTHMRQPVTLISLVGATLILSLTAPFNTASFLPPLPLVLYWAFTSSATYTLGYFLSQLFDPYLPTAHLGQPLRVLILALLLATGITALVMTINVLTFGTLPGGWGFVQLSLTIFALSTVVAGLIHILAEHLRPVTDADPAAPQIVPPPLLDRLPLDQRAPLVALSVEDHYVRIRTTMGETMVLLRLGDAIRETHGVDGMQVHRSHWVALEHVTNARREADRAVLTLAHGADIPVSRSYVPAIRAAGLLPKS